MIKLFNTKEEAIEKLPLFALRKININGEEIALVRISNGIKAFKNACPHDKASLASGDIVNNTVVCPWHHYHFDLQNGVCLDADCGNLEFYRIQETPEGLYLLIEE